MIPEKEYDCRDSEGRATGLYRAGRDGRGDGAQLFAALCNTGREGLDNAALGLLFEEMSGIKK